MTNPEEAYFKSRIRKNRPTKYFPVRGVKEEEVPKILLHNLFVAKDLEAAEKAIRKLPGVKRYRSGLRSAVKKDRFVNHLRRYIHMYRTDFPWEVSTTNRYTIISYEAAVTARQRIKQGETIKYLTGTLVPLTADESADLDLTQRNFSIVSSSRKKASSIFLGPARFANHDCDANARLVTKGGDSMEVIAMKNIDIGEEITDSYGEDYFGPSNIECLCHTCERADRYAWTSRRSERRRTALLNCSMYGHHRTLPILMRPMIVTMRCPKSLLFSRPAICSHPHHRPILQNTHLFRPRHCPVLLLLLPKNNSEPWKSLL